MANIELLELAQPLQMRAPDAALPYLMRELRNAIIQFCEESESYTAPLEPLTSVAGHHEYELDLPTYTRAVKILRLTYDGDPLRPSSETLLDQEMPGWQSKTRKPEYYFLGNNILTIAPAPPATLAGAIRGRIALKPTRNAPVIDEDFYEENEQAILDGAMHRIFQATGTPWGDVTLAQLHGALFREAIEEAKSKSRQDHTPKRRVMSYGGL